MITEHLSRTKNDIPNVYPFREFSKVQPGKTPRILAYRAGFPRAVLDPLLPSVHDEMLVIADSTEQMLGFLLECPLSEANALTLCCLKRWPVEACSGHQCTWTHARVWTHTHTHLAKTGQLTFQKGIYPVAQSLTPTHANVPLTCPELETPAHGCVVTVSAFRRSIR